jgi:hypothetical protein
LHVYLFSGEIVNIPAVQDICLEPWSLRVYGTGYRLIQTFDRKELLLCTRLEGASLPGV